MRFRKLGESDLEVSTVCCGCWAIVGGFNWGEQDQQDSLAALRAAYDAGVNFFDTAEIYGEGYSERLLHKALGDVREKIIIASKASAKNFRPADLKAACDRSLKNLGTDWIDLYQLHWPSAGVPAADTLGALEELKTAGKIRHIGVSNYGRDGLAECLASGSAVVSNQLAYSLIFRAIEYDILPFCVGKNVPVLCYAPLMQGLLTGKFRSADEVPEDRARTRHFSSSRPQTRHGEDGAEDETFTAIAEIRQIAAELGEATADVALAWLLAQEGVASVIAGARNASQASRNAKAADLELPADVVARLAALTEPVKEALGANADLWAADSRIR